MFALRQGKISKKRTKDSKINEITEKLKEKGLIKEGRSVLKLSRAGHMLNHELAALFSSNEMIEEALKNMNPKELKYAAFVHPEYLKGFKKFLDIWR